jgi:asparaginyl-tRNA synthetase
MGKSSIFARLIIRKMENTVARTKVKDLLKSEPGIDVVAKGWVRTKRGNKGVAFIALNDGSTINNIQLVVDKTQIGDDILSKVTTGACIRVEGKLVESVGGGQTVEIQASAIEVYGECDPVRYPLQKKDTSFEYLRTVAHMRMRTNTFGAVLRIRNQMAYAIHEYFHNKGFVYLHTPLITESDCEGAGQMFQVTTMDLEKPLPRNKKGGIDYSKDFFGKQTSLTVSGQLEGELGATALGEIYTFGPTFRAENSNTPRHLAEFWMIEPEMAFYDINDNMDLAEDFIKHLVKYALDNCYDDVKFLNDKYDPELIDRLKGVVETEFVRLEYTEGIKILEEAVANGVKFEYPVYWGVDLQSEHERYLVEKHFQKPVILTGYPKEIKAFYMKQDENGKTVRAMDVLFPKIGEIIGGSERESSLQKLEARINELGMSRKNLEWYIDTRRFGSCPHSGFGLGFERLLLFVTGMQNIRDVIPFPRTPKNAEF